MRPVGPLSTNAGSILSSVRRWCYGASVNVAHSLLRTAYLEILVEEDSRGLHRRFSTVM